MNEEQIFLPEKFNCPTLISFSGGRTSGYMLYKILESYGGGCQTMCMSHLQTQERKCLRLWVSSMTVL